MKGWFHTGCCVAAVSGWGMASTVSPAKWRQAGADAGGVAGVRGVSGGDGCIWCGKHAGSPRTMAFVGRAGGHTERGPA